MKIDDLINEVRHEIDVLEKQGYTLDGVDLLENDLHLMKKFRLLKDLIDVRSELNPEKPIFSDEFKNFMKSDHKLKPLTNTQHRFAEWLIENKKMVSQIGSLTNVFIAVRKYLKR
jgi:hypothetical protein